MNVKNQQQQNIDQNSLNSQFSHEFHPFEIDNTPDYKSNIALIDLCVEHAINN